MWHDGPCTVRSCGVDKDDPSCPKRVSLTENRKTLDIYRKLLSTVDVVSCSTERVADYVKRGATPRRTYVLPNLVRFDHYPQIDLAPRNGRVNILWQGGQNHYDDWYPLRNALGNINQEVPAGPLDHVGRGLRLGHGTDPAAPHDLPAVGSL